jgi:adenylosuccinate lyase
MAVVKSGADRQETHEYLREQSIHAWNAVAQGQANPLAASLLESRELGRYLSQDQLRELLDIHAYVGDAGERAREFAVRLRSALS